MLGMMVETLQDIEQLKGFVTEKLVLYHQQQAKRKTLRETMSQKNKHVMELLALKALEDGDEKVDKSNPPQLDELIETELRDFMQGSVIDDEDEKRSDAPSELVSKSKDEFKPILGQLKVTHDTVISYR